MPRYHYRDVRGSKINMANVYSLSDVAVGIYSPVYSGKWRRRGRDIILLHGNYEALNAVEIYRYVTANEVENDVEPSFDRNGGPDWKEGYGKNLPARWATFKPGAYSPNLSTKRQR